jgi:hypothetical protein
MGYEGQRKRKGKQTNNNKQTKTKKKKKTKNQNKKPESNKDRNYYSKLEASEISLNLRMDEESILHL